MSWFRAPLNEPLRTYDPRGGYRLNALARPSAAPPGTSVLLAFSGGGTRAAALAYGVLEELRASNNQYRLLDAVDMISSVSGGSFTAAFYGLFREKIFERFKDVFLLQPIRDRLLRRVALPWNWLRMMSPDLDRIDLAAELYEPLFEHRAFSDFPKTRPMIVLNATNMSLGSRFPFTQDQFDLIGSDLSGYSVARAVAASAAFPFAFSPLTLRNYGAPEGFPWQPIRRGLDDVQRNLARYQRNAAAWAYHDVDVHRYCHLLDGGLADNTGARHLIDLIFESEHLDALTNGSIKRLVVIVVDAKGTSRSARIDTRRRGPGILRVALATGTIALDNYTDDSAMAVEYALRSIQSDAVAEWESLTGQIWSADASDPAIRYPLVCGRQPMQELVSTYVVHVTFAALTDEKQRTAAMAVPTDLQLPPQQVQEVIALGRQLLTQDPAFQRLRQDLAAAPHASPEG